MAQKKIGDAGEDIVLFAAVGLGAWFLVNKLTGLFGADPADTATINNQATMPPTTDIFNFQYQPFVSEFNSGVPGTNADGSVMNMQQYFQALKAANDAGQTVLWHDINVATLGDALESALSGWHLATDSNAVFGVFSALSNKRQLAGLAAYIYYNYGDDLLSILQGSIFKPGLSASDLSLLITKMNALPG